MSRITTIPPELSGDSIEHFIWRDVNMEMPPEIEVELDDGQRVTGSPTLLVSVVNSKGYRYVTTDMTIDGTWVVNQGDWNHVDDSPIVGFSLVPDCDLAGCGLSLVQFYMCGNCYTEIEEDTKKCPNCGRRLWVTTDWI